MDRLVHFSCTTRTVFRMIWALFELIDRGDILIVLDDQVIFESSSTSFSGRPELSSGRYSSIYTNHPGRSQDRTGQYDQFFLLITQKSQIVQAERADFELIVQDDLGRQRNPRERVWERERGSYEGEFVRVHEGCSKKGSESSSVLVVFRRVGVLCERIVGKKIQGSLPASGGSKRRLGSLPHLLVERRFLYRLLRLAVGAKGETLWLVPHGILPSNTEINPKEKEEEHSGDHLRGGGIIQNKLCHFNGVFSFAMSTFCSLLGLRPSPDSIQAVSPVQLRYSSSLVKSSAR
ncbi:hypothetical protein IEQ34_010241 [Dendrobium chrysotoxum]|uniref:Uncharacterized protein n=1 Tax=Dendrobium chrysotoxum TaxID=161865 RepID=A0AAV7H2K9_DENCH|nr:hypothetical protein IEQ34_010241 [Dendrobium chrysotoxum]